jgi:hypothetical protein
MKEITFNPAAVLFVGVILNTLGSLIKAIPWIQNHYIPFILAGAGAVAYPAVEGLSGINILLGVAVAIGAVGAHQTLVQGAELKPKV